jgi:hypothetical protein
MNNTVHAPDGPSVGTGTPTTSLHSASLGKLDACSCEYDACPCRLSPTSAAAYAAASDAIAENFISNALRFSGFNDAQREDFRVRKVYQWLGTSSLFP